MLASLFTDAQITTIKKKYQRIWVAYSGGVDSHVLLHMAQQTFTNINAIHINHKISTLDDLYQQHCMQVCAQLGIALQCVDVDLNESASMSLELCARIARRKVWQQYLSENDLLLLAHHADDQAETILYRFIRGSGPRGLIGIRASAKLGAVTIKRPLLSISKKEILEYAYKHNLQWIEDHCNESLAIDRNFLRKTVLPLLQTRWPAVQKNINRNGKVARQLLKNIDPHLKNDLDKILHPDGTLSIQSLKEKDLSWQLELLRSWLIQHAIYPTNMQLLQVQKMLIVRHDAMPLVQIGKKAIRRANHKLFVLDYGTAHAAVSMPWDLLTPLQLPNGEQLQPTVFNPTQIQKMLGYKVTVRIGGGGRKAKKVFQQHQIPPWERHKFPLIFADNRLVEIVGLWSSPRF